MANVHKALWSAAQMVRNGNNIVMGMDATGNGNAYVESKNTGERLWMRQGNGVYVLNVMVAPPGYKQKEPRSDGQEMRQASWWNQGGKHVGWWDPGFQR